MEHLDLDVTQLDLDCRNPRHDRVAGQEAALGALLADQGRKLSNLALDIHSKGLSPAQRFMVIEQSNGRYTVLDGNRRLAAIRLLANPELLPPDVGPADFASLVAVPGSRPDRIACCLMPDRESASAWLERTHTGQLDGIGVVPWSTVAQHRFKPRDRRTQTSSAVAVLDWLRDRTDGTVHRQIDTVLRDATTNLGRLLTDQVVRGLIGFTFEGHAVVPLAPEATLVRRFSAIVADLAGGTVVTTLTHRGDREQHIRGLLGGDLHRDGDGEQLDLGSAQADGPSGYSGETTVEEPKSALPTPESDRRASPSSKDQPGFSTRRIGRRPSPRLFQDLTPDGLQTRTRNIFEELQRLDLSRFPNSAAVVLRSAIELSIVEYLESLDVNLNTVRTLSDRIDKAIDQIEVPKKSQRYHGIRTELAKCYSLTRATNLNSYVHNPHHPPVADELEAISVRYTILIQDISDALEQGSGN
ncbi:MAG: hypothetical protein OXQ32_05460 [bacterium]|nr:hypothetical protein [bacterium]